MAEITTSDVLKALQPLWLTKPETARRLRGRLERLFDAAKVEGFRSGDNPAAWRGNLETLLPRQGKHLRSHHAALPYVEINAFLHELRGRPFVAALALEFLILTATRTSETLNAQWEEIDLNRGLWTIPAARMKSGREHRVPLSRAAQNILNKLKTRTKSSYVFEGQKPNTPHSNMAMLQLLKRLGRQDLTVHGFRSTFRDWVAEETSYPNQVAEMALAHVIKDKAEAAYRRGDLLDKRQKLMEAWAQYCSEVHSDNILKLPNLDQRAKS